MSRKTFPSFSFVISSHRESFTPPNPIYHKQYESDCQETGSPPDLMKTIDHRGQDGFESSVRYFLPDIFEEDETEVDSQTEHETVGPDDGHARDTDSTQCVKKAKKLGWMWRLVRVVLKHRGRKDRVSKNN